MCFSCGAEAPVDLAAGDFDREDRSGLGELGVCVSAEGFDEGIFVEHCAIGLAVCGFEESAFDNLCTTCAGSVFDGVFDFVGLLSEVGNLSQQSTEGVYACEGQIVVHGSLSVVACVSAVMLV